MWNVYCICILFFFLNIILGLDQYWRFELLLYVYKLIQLGSFIWEKKNLILFYFDRILRKTIWFWEKDYHMLRYVYTIKWFPANESFLRLCFKFL